MKEDDAEDFLTEAQGLSRTNKEKASCKQGNLAFFGECSTRNIISIYCMKQFSISVLYNEQLSSYISIYYIMNNVENPRTFNIMYFLI